MLKCGWAFLFTLISLASQASTLPPFQSPKDSTEKISLLLKLSNNCLESGEYALAGKYAQQSLKEAESGNNKESIVSALNALSAIFVAEGKLSQSIEIDRRLYTNFYHQLTDKEKGRLLYNLGTDYQGLAEYKTAHRYFTSAIALFKRARDLESESECYRQMAQMYLEIYDTTNATRYLNQFITTANSDKLVNQAAANLIQGEIREQQKRFDEALFHYERALADYKQASDQFGQDYASCNLLNLYVLRQEYEKAIQLAQRTLPNINKMHATLAVVFYPSLGSAYFRKPNPNYVLAEQYLRIGLDLAVKSNITTDVQFANSELAKLYEQKGDFRRALKHTKEANRIKDSLTGIENTGKLNELEVKYQSAEKERKIDILNEEKKIALLESSKQLQQRNNLLIGLGLMTIILVIGTLAYRNNKKHNRYLAKEQQRKELLLREVHHRTNNSLQLISALLTMQSYQVDDPEVKEILKKSESRIHSMAALHELLHNNVSQISVNMSEYLHQVIAFHQDLATENIKIYPNINSTPFPSKLALPLALIANELITNALKYAFNQEQNKKEIHIMLGPTEKEAEWVLSVKDNGCGLPKDAFEAGQGNMGSRLIRILSKQVRGRLTTTSQNGTLINIYFPFQH